MEMNIGNKKRKRTVLTARQHRILMVSFEECAFPDAEQRLVLGRILDMTPRTVQIWFQNQRQKVRNHAQEQRSSQSSEETVENVENARKQSSTKSLSTLAQLACIEYDRRFSKSDERVEQQ